SQPVSVWWLRCFGWQKPKTDAKKYLRRNNTYDKNNIRTQREKGLLQKMRQFLFDAVRFENVGGQAMDSYNRRVLDLAMGAGKILLQSGAEIFRVEETIRRISRHYGVENSNAFVLSNGIFLTGQDQMGEMYAYVKHIPISGTQLNKVDAVNRLSREIEQGLDLELAEK